LRRAHESDTLTVLRTPSNSAVCCMPARSHMHLLRVRSAIRVPLASFSPSFAKNVSSSSTVDTHKHHPWSLSTLPHPIPPFRETMQVAFAQLVLSSRTLLSASPCPSPLR
jgi:hypothetical protein